MNASGLTDEQLDEVASVFADAALDALWREYEAAEAMGAPVSGLPEVSQIPESGRIQPYPAVGRAD